MKRIDKLSKLIATTLMLGGAILLLTACGNATAPASDDHASGDNEQIRIGFAMPERDAWLTLKENAAVAHAEDLGVYLRVFDAQFDINQQINHVQTFAAQGFDAIIINGLDPAFTETLIESASGVPIIFVNRFPGDQYLEPGSAGFVGSDETTVGPFQVEFLSQYFGDRTEPLDYVIFMGILGHNSTLNRTNSFREAAIEAGFTMNNVFEQSANFDRAIAMDLMQQFLGTGQNFDVVIANNDEMALGAIEAMRAVGITDIPVIGVDASPSGVQSIIDGDLNASVFQNPVGQGAGAVDKAIAAANGEVFPAVTWVPFELVTPDNVDNYR